MGRGIRLLIILLSALAFTAPALIYADDYWPTTGWRESTPEEQGIDSSALAVWPHTMFGPHTSLVIRHGYVIFDASAHPFNSAQQHALFSATSSFVSTLIGIAIDKGYITNVQQSIWDFLPKDNIANMDPRKEAITIEDLLTHRSGLDIVQPLIWNELYTLTGSDQDWVKYILDRPMAEPPGTRFNFLDGNPLILSAILQKAINSTALEFAKENLFEPLGITEYLWLANPQGVTIGNDELYMSPRDFAKLGYLYLHNGQWEGRQIVSSAWVRAATSSSVSTYRSCKQLSTNDHGYLWWLSDVGASGHMGYAALGYGGQELWVIPDVDTVVVFTGAPRDGQTLIANGLLPAIRSDGPLPANPAAVSDMNERVRLLANPAPSAVASLSEAMQSASGQRFQLRQNALGWNAIRVDFGAQEARLTIETSDASLEYPVGLDSVYRISQDSLPAAPALMRLRADLLWALRGFLSPDTSELQIYGWDVAGRDSWSITLEFRPDRLKVTVSAVGQKWLIFS